MLPMALNHKSAPRLRYDALIDLASSLGCIGVEFRNDLDTPLFEGDAPEKVARKAREKNIRIVGLSQVGSFNDWSSAKKDEVASLIAIAAACGAETINLIPRNDGLGTADEQRQANLRLALSEILPMLETANLVALVEPLGFTSSSLRFKSEVVDVIEALSAQSHIKLVHDTFHHHLAEIDTMHAAHTGIVHISGVTDPDLAVSEMRDDHRILVDAHDRLGNIDQIAELIAQGYAGPISFEPFAPEIHALEDPYSALKTSIEFIQAGIAEKAS